MVRNAVMRWNNLPNCGELLTKFHHYLFSKTYIFIRSLGLNYQTKIAIYLVAMGNSKGMVKRLRIETIDAANYNKEVILNV